MIDALAAAGRDADGHPVVDKVVGHGGARLHPRRAGGAGAGRRLRAGAQGRQAAARDVHAVSYALEYGEATLELHQDASRPATGCCWSTTCWPPVARSRATRELIEACGGTAHGLSVLMELGFLSGRAQVGDLPVSTLLTV